MSTKSDPRVLRTRKLLREALLALIPKQGYAAITIQDITEEATLNRTTFYMHYRDKDELFQQLIAEVLDDMAQLPKQKPDQEANIAYVYRVYRHVFEHVAAHYAFYHLMFTEPSVAAFIQQIQARIEAIAMRWIPPEQWPHVTIAPELFISFISTAFLGVIRWWLTHDMPTTPDLMAQQFIRLTLLGMHQDFGLAAAEIDLYLKHLSA